MSSIFISHSSSDNEIARELGRRLAEQHHPSIFLDLDPEQGIVAGRSWEQTLYRKLRACRAVIALCTDHYLGSQWCFAEIALARMEGKHIIALLADPLGPDAKLPAILTKRQFIDLRENPEEGYRRLWKGLKEKDILGVAGEWDPGKPPYLGLSAFHEEHAPVFFGREEETRAGIELLDRGAPGLIMVLGASGSGKSSLVRAGMLPRLRREPQQWLVVDPFRPGHDPFTELATALERSWRRYAPEQAARAGSWERMHERLVAAADRLARPAPELSATTARAEGAAPAGGDERVGRLMRQIEELRVRPPEEGGGRLKTFLDWSLEDLRRITGEARRVPDASGAEGNELAEIARELLRQTPDRQDACVLLIIDQFEEALGHDDPSHAANRFLALLGNALEDERCPVRALGTMRSDFLGLFQRNPALRGMDFESLSLGPMRPDGMKRVIEEPAKLGALVLDPGLADRLLADAETPDALPLLSFTLWKLWKDCRQDGKLKLGEYQKLGGLHGAVAGEADAELASARRTGQEEGLREALLRMVRVTEDGGYARRPASWEEEEIQQVAPILERFVDRRLLVSRMEGDTRTVEVAHEALFRSWKPLKAWLDDHRAELLLREQIRRDAATWSDSRRSEDTLWRGGRLQEAEAFLDRGRLPAPESDFIRAGVNRRRRDRRRRTGVTLAIFFALTFAAVFSFIKKREAEDERTRALDLARVAVASRLLGTDSVYAALVLAEVERPDATSLATHSMTRVLEEALPDLEFRHRDTVVAVSFDAGGSRLATGSDDNTARVWNAATGEPLTGSLRHEGDVTSAELSRDGTQLVTASKDGKARVWNAVTGKLQTVIEHQKFLWSAAFSRDGERVVTASAEGSAAVWSAATGEEIARTPNQGTDVTSASFSPDGRRILTVRFQGGAQVWDAASGRPVTEPFGVEIASAAFGPSGERVVTGSERGTARVWSAGSGVPMTPPLEHGKAIASAAFSRDGTLVATAGEDRKARVWDAGTGALMAELDHDDAVVSAAFSPDGRQLVTASEDRTARVWEYSDGRWRQDAVRTFRHTARVRVAAFQPGGARVVTGAGTARLWSAARAAPEPEPRKHEGEVYSAAFGPGAAVVATASADRTAGAWDAVTGRSLTGSLSHADEVLFVALSRDAKQVVTASADDTARIWRVDGGEPVAQLAHAADVLSATFSGDGSRVVTASADDTARVWDAVTGTPLTPPLEHNDEVLFAALSSDGSQAVTASADDTARVWEVPSGDAVTKPLEHGDDVVFAVFDLGGSRVVTASWDKKVGMWNARSGAPETDPLEHDGEPQYAAFSEDGTLLLTATLGGEARVWDAASGLPVTEPLEHTGELLFATFDPSGTRVATTSKNGTAVIWNARTGEQLIRPLEHGGAMWVLSAAFAPGGWLRTVTADGRVRSWPVSGALLQERLRAQTRVCLDPAFRQTELGETSVEALERFQRCEAGHARCLDPELLGGYAGADFASIREHDAECRAAKGAAGGVH